MQRSIPRCIENTSKNYKEAIESFKTNSESSESTKSVLLAVETGVDKGWSSAVAVEQCELVRLRNTQTAQQKIKAFLSKG